VPTYDYRCTACGREIEVVHGIHAAGPTICEVCGGTMRKALSPPAIHFRGGGWAKKDAQAASTGKTAAAASADKAAGPGEARAGEPARAGESAGEPSASGGSAPAAASGGDKAGEPRKGGSSAKAASAPE
jgi:putative FmdB family regulatory protein